MDSDNSLTSYCIKYYQHIQIICINTHKLSVLKIHILFKYSTISFQIYGTQKRDIWSTAGTDHLQNIWIEIIHSLIKKRSAAEYNIIYRILLELIFDFSVINSIVYLIISGPVLVNDD